MTRHRHDWDNFLHELKTFRCRWQEWRVFDKRAQNDTGKMSSLSQFNSRFRQCCAMHMHALSIESLSRQHQSMLQTQLSETWQDCSIVTSQTSADVNRQLATASRFSFVDDAVENTLEMMWDIYLMSLDAQVIVLSRLHLVCALVVTMTMTQQLVNNSCHANRTRSKRSAVNRKLKNAEREKREDSEWLEKAQMKNMKNSNSRGWKNKCASLNEKDCKQNRKKQVSTRWVTC